MDILGVCLYVIASGFTKCVFNINFISWLETSKKKQKTKLPVSMVKDNSPGSESEFPVGDWQKLEGMNTLFLGTVK